MEKNYAETTGEGTAAIHCETETLELIYEAIIRLYNEFPENCPVNWRESKRNLVKLKQDIEPLLFPDPEQRDLGLVDFVD